MATLTLQEKDFADRLLVYIRQQLAPPVREELIRYADDGDGDGDGDGGRWVTIGANQGDDGEKHGGTPVYIKDGKIIKGPAALHGRSVAQLKSPAKATKAEPGTDDKIEVMRRRLERGLSIFDKDDARPGKATAETEQPKTKEKSEPPSAVGPAPVPANPETGIPPEIEAMLKRMGLQAVPATPENTTPPPTPKPDPNRPVKPMPPTAADEMERRNPQGPGGGWQQQTPSGITHKEPAGSSSPASEAERWLRELQTLSNSGAESDASQIEDLCKGLSRDDTIRLAKKLGIARTFTSRTEAVAGIVRWVNEVPLAKQAIAY